MKREVRITAGNRKRMCHSRVANQVLDVERMSKIHRQDAKVVEERKGLKERG